MEEETVFGKAYDGRLVQRLTHYVRPYARAVLGALLLLLTPRSADAVGVPAFLGWFTRSYELTYPKQDASPGSGGLGPLPKSNLLVKITRRQRSAVLR